jgi:hypothetical protein
MLVILNKGAGRIATRMDGVRSGYPTIALRLEPSSTGDKRDDMSAYAPVLAIVPFVPGVRCPLAWAFRGCFLSCQNCSIKRTPGRTLLTALSQLLWRDKGREVWFSLGENHEKASGFDPHQLRNCSRGEFCSPQAAPSRGAPMMRQAYPSLSCHFSFVAPKSSGRQALMFPR